MPRLWFYSRSETHEKTQINILILILWAMKQLTALTEPQKYHKIPAKHGLIYNGFFMAMKSQGFPLNVTYI